jgi:Tfp pilus assembly protein PilO
MHPASAGLLAQYRRDLGDVAVLTPYKAQLAQLRRTFQQVGLRCRPLRAPG